MQFSPIQTTQDYSHWLIPNNFAFLNQEEQISEDNHKPQTDPIFLESLTVDSLKAILNELYEVYRLTVVELYYKKNTSYIQDYANFELDEVDDQNKIDELDDQGEVDALDNAFELDEVDELDKTFELDENYVLEEELDEQSILEDAKFNEEIKSLYVNVNAKVKHESAFAKMAEEKFNPSNDCLEEFLYVIKNNRSHGILNIQNAQVFFELAKYFELDWLIRDCMQFFHQNCSGFYTQNLNDFLRIDANRFIKK